MLLTVSVSTEKELQPFYDLLARFTGFVLLASSHRKSQGGDSGEERPYLEFKSCNHIIQYYSMMTIADCMDYPRHDLD